MQKVVSKVALDGNEYYKILNVVNGSVVHFNIILKTDLGYRELIPSDVPDALRRKLMDVKGDLPVNKKESLKLLGELDRSISRSRGNVERMLTAHYKRKVTVKLVSSFIGISYCVLKFEGKLFMQVFQMFIGEDGEVRGFNPLPLGNMEAVLSDVARKLSVKEKSVFIRMSDSEIYGIKRLGGNLVLASFVIDRLDVKCRRAYGLSIDWADNRRNNDSTINEKIEKMASDMTQELAQHLYNEIMKYA